MEGKLTEMDRFLEAEVKMTGKEMLNKQKKEETKNSHVKCKKRCTKVLSIMMAVFVAGGNANIRTYASEITAAKTQISNQLGTITGNVTTPTPTPTVTPTPQAIVNPIRLGNKITYGSLSKSKKLDTTNMAFLANLTNGTLVATANSSTNIYLSELSEMMTMLIVLNHSNLEDVVVVSKEALNLAGEGKEMFGLAVGDSYKVKDLLTCYLLTKSDDARAVLVTYVAGSEKKFVAMMNRKVKELNLTNTKFISSDGTYGESQYSMLHDLYLVMYQLMENNWFAANMGQESTSITYHTSKAEQKTKTCVNQNIQKYGKVTVPDGYTFLAQFTGSDTLALGNQIVILKDAKGNAFISILIQVPLERNISKESAALLKVLVGDNYSYDNEDDSEVEPTPIITPKPSVIPAPTNTPSPTPKVTQTPAINLPTKSNNERYQYLLGTNYKAYTIGNPPEGYKSAAQAIKNMTTITVPVWKMTASGAKYSSTMQLTINKKLEESCRIIFEEIYELDMKFPFKTLTGYQYRKVGGVGLVKSTLMSIHSFGAAIDINMGNYDNDYYLGAGNDLRNKNNPYCIPDEVIDIFEKNGWFWGGNFSISADTMHFQYLGLEFLTYQGKDPFRKLTYISGNEMTGSDVRNLQQRLSRLGFQIKIDGVYGQATETVVKKAQKKYGLLQTGIVDYSTWEKIINLTHDMSFVF